MRLTPLASASPLKEIALLTMTNHQVLRHADFSLTDEQHALREMYSALLSKDCTPERVRNAEPIGFDKELWQQLLEVGATAMGVPTQSGGDGGGLVELALVAEQVGRALAPVPFVEAAVSTRLLARSGAAAGDWLRAALSGDRLVTLALDQSRPGAAQLVPAGSVADAVIGLVDDLLVVVTRTDGPAHHVANHASSPLAHWDLSDPDTHHEVVLEGHEAVAVFEQARREWDLLTAAALIGIADGALALATEFARDRVAFGVPIASFQGVAHPLANCAIDIVGGRRLVWKAAWFADNEPAEERHLIPMAFLHASRAAGRATTVGVHTQGGLGFTLESDMQLFFRRAKGWANVAGDPARQRRVIADALYGPARV